MACFISACIELLLYFQVVEGKRVGGTISGGDENSETQHETSVDSADDLNQPRNIDVASYEIVGTLSNSDASKPDWVAEVIEVLKDL